jgi:predicted methyltransferase
MQSRRCMDVTSNKIKGKLKEIEGKVTGDPVRQAEGKVQSTAGKVAATSGSGSAPAPIPPYTPAADVPQAIKDAVAAPDRSDDDRRLDAGRKPAEVLAFFHVAPGQKIGELFASGGYTTEVMARVVGPTGKVFAENTKELMDKFLRKPWSDRAAKPVMANVVGVERPLDDPFPPEAKDLDLVVTVLNYHDTAYMKTDRAKMNKAVLASLKKGGYYGIVDSSATDGSGVAATETLHRIDQKIVESEVKAAGFKPAGESHVLRNPDDKRLWSSSPKAGEKRGTSDRFVLLFQKP